MNKVIIAGIFLICALGLLFGCTMGGAQADSNIKITNSNEAIKVVNDVSTDISGISNTLGEIDAALTDTNSENLQ